MDGKEVQATQLQDGSWTANDGTKSTAGLLIEGKGLSEQDARADFLVKKASIVNQVVGATTKVNNEVIKHQQTVTQKIDVTVSRLMVVPHKHPKPGYEFVAYRSDNPGLQGYGTTETAAKVDLFEKEKPKQ